MRKTETKIHSQAHNAVLKGVNAIYNPVRLTLGPEGGHVLLHRTFNRGSRITNDGVTVAQCVEPKDPFINLVATAFKEGAKKTSERAGDGTTSTTIIAGRLINDVLSSSSTESSITIRGLEEIRNHGGIISLKKNLLSLIPKIKEYIKKSTKKIKTQEELTNIIDISLGGNPEVAKTLSEMVWKTGPDGFITLTDGFTGELETSIIEGARFPMKIDARFITNPDRYEMVAEDCPVLITNHALATQADFANVWNNLKVNKLIIFAPSFSDEVLKIMMSIMFKVTQDRKIVETGVRVFPVRCPSLGSEDLTPHNFHDLALYCGARFIDKKNGDTLQSITTEDLGFLEKCTVKSAEDKEDAVLLGGKGANSEATQKQIESLRERIKLTKLHPHKALIQKRIASLASRGGLIRVGAPTEAESLPLKHKIEDAIFAGQSALKHGYVQGAGLCLKNIAEGHFKANKLVYDALCAPYNQLCDNSPEAMREISDNVIDPAQVVELEVEHGFGVAANMITIKAIIPEFDEHDPKDGYKTIADAIKEYTIYYAKREGLYQEGLGEATAEANQRREALMDQEND